MSLFNKNRESERTIEEILSPKEEIEESTESNEELCKRAEKSDASINVEKKKADLLNPMSCFGMSEEKTEKWLKCCVKAWYYMMSFVWFLFGAVTFAPVVFISKNVDVIFNSKKKSLLFGFMIYAIFVALIVFLIVTRTTPQPIPTN